ncbi:uncharacterized protein FRV6_06983 [Fusarium oxysporum]|uniref:Uncharacterized protein n=1 Tax=Fusarium oxysporum TaxID=5507 RepID=A0A2H3TI70_FUSOX|nr:uncharacterized protein FRV6_06983 [Fusarium oxysporum]
MLGGLLTPMYWLYEECYRAQSVLEESKLKSP